MYLLLATVATGATTPEWYSSYSTRMTTFAEAFLNLHEYRKCYTKATKNETATVTPMNDKSENALESEYD